MKIYWYSLLWITISSYNQACWGGCGSWEGGALCFGCEFFGEGRTIWLWSV